MMGKQDMQKQTECALVCDWRVVWQDDSSDCQKSSIVNIGNLATIKQQH